MTSPFARAVPLLVALVISAPAALAQQAFTVNATHDADDADPGDGVCADAEGNCTLRAAITEANAHPEQATVIHVPAGTYVLSIVGEDDTNAAGDLDITSEITLLGEDSATTIIDAAGIDRVFDVHAGAAASFEALTIRGGRIAGRGAGIRIIGAVTQLTDVLLIDNRTIGTLAEGGAVYVTGQGNTLKITTSQLIDNEATWGGAISNNGSNQTTIEVRGSTLADNLARSSGGAVESKGIATSENVFLIENSTLSGNTAAGSAGSGGGIFHNGLVLHIINSTISGNEAVYGGGLAITGRTVKIEQSTITENHADQQGGGFMRTGGTTTVRNTIVAGNTAHPLPQAGHDIHNPEAAAANLILHGYNLIGASAGFWYTPGPDGGANQFDVDPLLGPLANNGGPTSTHALDEDGPAIDAGDCLMLDGVTITEVDQRYFVRLDTCDIGAFEFGAQPVGIDSPPVASAAVLGPAFPNPTTDGAALPLRLDEARDVRIEVFDLTGRRVATLVEGPMEAGDREIAVEMSRLAAGTYVVRVLIDGHALSERLTVVR